MGLDGVGMQKRLRSALPHERGDFGERLHRANLVVDRHHRDELHRPIEGVGETIEVDPPVPVDADDAPAAVLDRVKNGVVFDGRTNGNRVGAGPAQHPEDGHVVGLGAVAAEHDLARIDAEAARDVVAGLIDRPPRVACQRVATRRVRVALREERKQRRHGFGAHRRAGRVIEVCHRGHGHEATGMLSR